MQFDESLNTIKGGSVKYFRKDIDPIMFETVEPELELIEYFKKAPNLVKESKFGEDIQYRISGTGQFDWRIVPVTNEKVDQLIAKIASKKAPEDQMEHLKPV